MAHAKLSPSSSKRWMTCTASVGFIERLELEGKISKQVPNKYAAEGTVAHTIHEQCLMDNKKALNFLGRTMEADGFKFTVNQDMVDAVQLGLDHIEDLINSYAEMSDYTVELLVEQYAPLTHLGIEGLDGGTADVILLFKDVNNVVKRIIVIDYKHGSGVTVEPEHNTQALQYGLGVLKLIENNFDISLDGKFGISLIISQPRIYHDDGRFRSWELSQEDLLKWVNDSLIPKAKETHSDNAVFKPSDDACRFCLAAPHCLALNGLVEQTAIVDFEDVKPNLPNVETLSYKQKTVILDNASMIRSFLTAVEKQVKEEVENGSSSYRDKYKLVRKMSRRQLTENAKDSVFSPLFNHLKHEEIYIEKIRPMGELEKALKKRIGNKLCKEVMSEITTKPEGELLIAPISDKRKEVLLGDDFNGITN